MQAFLDVAPDSDFSIHNLPYGVFQREGEPARVGVALGAYVIDLAALQDAGIFDDAHPLLAETQPFDLPALNPFMALGKDVWDATRETLQRILSTDDDTLSGDADLREAALFAMNEVEMLLPAEVGDYTDFYSSREHATNVGTIFRGPENALKPNWLHLPVGYHGRASSIVPSGTPVRRPKGQKRPEEEGGQPRFGPSGLLDFELEMGFFIGPGNELGESVDIEDAEEHIFGLALVNDWSARDIQGWEYVPLGPFLGKSFATTVSPWIVPLAALEPFRTDGPQQDPAPLPYLAQDGPHTFDIQLAVDLQAGAGGTPTTICRSNFRYLYWSMAQQLAHHTVNGCNLQPGDLLASGTISGPDEGSRGSLLELTWRGRDTLTLDDGTERTFLQDGDTVTLRAWCEHEDGYRVGFGEATGQILPPAL